MLSRARCLQFARCNRPKARMKVPVEQPQQETDSVPFNGSRVSLEDIRNKDDEYFVREEQHKRGELFRKEYTNLCLRERMTPEEAKIAKAMDTGETAFPVPDNF